MNKQWYQQFFQGIASDFWDQIVPEEFTEREGFLVSSLLNIEPRAQILDVPSGRGRMSLWLAKNKDFRVTGFDIDAENIFLMNERAKNENVQVVGAKADLTVENLILGSYDGAICLGNSFGYFDKMEMKNFLDNVSRSLAEKKRWIIQTGMLAENIFPNWQNEDEYWSQDHIMKIKNTYNWEECRMEIQAVFIDEPGNEVVKNFYHYIYTLKDVSQMLEDAGFKIVDLCNYEGEEFALGDEQVYIVAQKK